MIFCAYSKRVASQIKFLQNSDNQMSFPNQGGLANGGVCWWHSRFTRNAAYLALFLPSNPKPDARLAREIVQRLRAGDQVVSVPGYRNLREFSADWEDEIQRNLEVWQSWDGFFKQSWVIGLSGRSKHSPKRMKRDMDRIYTAFGASRDVAYHRLQIPGIVSHAWLMVDMAKSANGYKLKVVDSNFPGETHSMAYVEGQESFEYFDKDAYAYPGQERELRALKIAAQKFCP